MTTGTTAMTGTRPNATDDAARGGVVELRVSLPTRALFLGVTAASLAVAGLWAAVVGLGPWDKTAFTTGLVGAAIMGVLALNGVLIMTPWKPRAFADWMTVWLAATVFRMLVTPSIVFLIYSATSETLPAKPLGLSVALTYMATLFVEAAIIARHMNDFAQPTDDQVGRL